MFEEHANKIIGGLVTFFATGALWLIRIIVGNQRRISVLEAEAKWRGETLKDLKTMMNKILEKMS